MCADKHTSLQRLTANAVVKDLTSGSAAPGALLRLKPSRIYGLVKFFVRHAMLNY
jgi:hypothetical protein